MSDKQPLTPQQMHEKIDAFRQKALIGKSKKASVSNSAGIVITIVSDLLGGLLVGAGIGWVIFKIFDTHLIVMGIFVLLGGLAGFLNLYKSLNVLERQNK